MDWWIIYMLGLHTLDAAGKFHLRAEVLPAAGRCARCGHAMNDHRYVKRVYGWGQQCRSEDCECSWFAEAEI